MSRNIFTSDIENIEKSLPNLFLFYEENIFLIVIVDGQVNLTITFEEMSFEIFFCQQFHS